MFVLSVVDCACAGVCNGMVKNDLLVLGKHLADDLPLAIVVDEGNVVAAAGPRRRVGGQLSGMAGDDAPGNGRHALHHRAGGVVVPRPGPQAFNGQFMFKAGDVIVHIWRAAVKRRRQGRVGAEEIAVEIVIQLRRVLAREDDLHTLFQAVARYDIHIGRVHAHIKRAQQHRHRNGEDQQP